MPFDLRVFVTRTVSLRARQASSPLGRERTTTRLTVFEHATYS